VALRGTALIEPEVGGVGAEHRLVRAYETFEAEDIRCGAIEDEESFSVGTEHLFEARPGGVGEWVGAVARAVARIDGYQGI
jgi:hypothetical protein